MFPWKVTTSSINGFAKLNFHIQKAGMYVTADFKSKQRKEDAGLGSTDRRAERIMLLKVDYEIFEIFSLYIKTKSLSNNKSKIQLKMH